MKQIIVLLIILFLISCSKNSSQNKMFFDGRKVCLDESKVQLISSDKIGISGLDKSSEILLITYKSGDPLYDHFVDQWGLPDGNFNYVSYSLMKLTEPEIEKYRNHKLIKEAFERKGSFQGAVLKDFKLGFVKVRRRMETYTWEVFRSPIKSSDNAFDIWVGNCTQFSNVLKCSFFDIHENYLLEVNLAQNFLLEKKQVRNEIISDIKDNIFCDIDNWEKT